MGGKDTILTKVG